MTESVKEIMGESGLRCGNCDTWRLLCDDYFIEKCPKCGDDEIYIFEVEEP